LRNLRPRHHSLFDFKRRPGYKRVVIDISFMSFWQFLDGAAQLITAIARMLGKTVKFRCCPATVSAPASFSECLEAGDQP
jgi:hypothetical protein